MFVYGGIGKMWAVLRRLSAAVNKIAIYVCIVMFVMVILNCSLQVFTRYVINAALPWTEELARFSFVWMSLLGGSVCVKHKSHAVVTVIINYLPDNVRSKFILVADALVLFGAVLMIVQGWKMVAVTGRQLSPAMYLPMSYVYLSVPISGLAIFVHKISDISEWIVS